MRFDNEFLEKRRAKEADWAAQGQRTGSGSCFSSDSGGLAGKVPPARQRLDKAAREAEVSVSPHAAALAVLAKNPDLRTGGIINGKKRNADHEHWEQVILFDWLEREYPDYYDDFAAVPNGGLRDKRTANSLYAEGAKAGYPDITGDVPTGQYHGLFIELKWGKNKPSEKQIAAMNRKRRRGYFCALCYGWEEAREVITEYLGLPAGGVMTWSKNEDKWLELPND